MFFFGHIAISLCLADATESDRTAAVAGNLLPDVVDKTGGWVLKVMPSARWLAHGLPCFSLLSGLALLLLDRRRARGFILGYAGHLVADLWAGGRVPWFAPFERHKQRPPGKKTRSGLALYFLPEAVGLPVIALLLRKEKTGAPNQ